jgi:hypothetical protein
MNFTKTPGCGAFIAFSREFNKDFGVKFWWANSERFQDILNSYILGALKMPLWAGLMTV